LIKVARRISGDLVEYSKPKVPIADPLAGSLPPEDDLLTQYDRRIMDVDLRTATRSRFVSKHYADAVESGVKALNECVRARTGRSEDGDALMTVAFSPNAPMLGSIQAGARATRVSNVGTCSCARVSLVHGAIHEAHSLVVDSSGRALMMLENIDGLIASTKAATRTRSRKKP
jgi:uncharacterized protein (TIGR02391 family)